MIKGKGTFKVLINGKVKTFDNWNKIPLSFENMIEFDPDPITDSHNEEAHEYMETFSDKLNELMKRETK
jgi:hypothetical protein